MNEDKFIEWYRNRFGQVNEESPEDVWDNISKQLDVDEVWDDVKNHLVMIDRKKKTHLIFLALSLLFLIGTTSIWYFSSPQLRLWRINSSQKDKFLSASGGEVPNNQSPEKSNMHSANNDNYNQKPANSSELYSSVPSKNNFLTETEKKENIIKKDISRSNTYKAITANNSIINHSNEYANAAFSYSQAINSEKEVISIIYLPIIKPTTVSLPDGLGIIPLPYYFTSSDSITDKTLMPPAFSTNGFYIGIFAYGSNPWLLNNSTFAGLKSSELSQTAPYFNISFGASAGYISKHNWALQMDWQFNSHYGQIYKFYDEGRYVQENIRLSYQRFDVLYANLTKKTFRTYTPASRNIIAGINVKVLNKATNILNSNESDATSSYQKLDYGITLGYEYEILFKKRFLFSSTLMADVGLKNIKSDTSHEPAKFNRTHNASLGVKVGLKYLISQYEKEK